MNYIKQLNSFYDLLLTNPLNANSQCLYYALLNINNKCNWKKEFAVANSAIMTFTSLNMSALQRARNQLIQKGYIKYKKGTGNNAGIYSIIEFEQQSEQQNEQQSEQQTDNNANTLYKLNKTKQNNNENDNELYEHFEKIWELYPVKKGKSKAETYFFAWLKGRKINGRIRKLTDKEMWYAVNTYLKELEETKQDLKYVPHGSTFFNTKIYDYYELWKEKNNVK